MITPVVLIIYNRSENLARILMTVRLAKPKNIYIISDGPKNEQDGKKVNQVRQELERLIDWDCEVMKNYAKSNMGLKERFSTGISWVFEHEDSAIFLEDDCIPSNSFFKFADEMLVKYQNDTRVMTISGDNFQFGKLKLKESYYFSRYPHVWGWATWKRAWKLYDKDLKDWPKIKKTKLIENITGSKLSSLYWRYIFDKMYHNKINTWDYQLTYACFKNKGLNIIPSVNLVTNVGYGEGATNTKRKSRAIGQYAVELSFPLVHPQEVIANTVADARTDQNVFLNPLGIVSLLVKSILGII